MHCIVILMIRESDAMWCLVLFDLPVESVEERRDASRFRGTLLDNGYSMVQFSVYGKYSPSVKSNQSIEKFIKANLPARGKVCILHLTDNQWANASRFISAVPEKKAEQPSQLVIF